MSQTPLGHDRTAARDDAGQALGSDRHIGQSHAGMDGEVIDALLRLLDQGVAEQLPGQILGHAIDLFQSLVDRHGADRHRRVAQDPLPGLVDVLAGGQVHQRVAAPARGPGHLLDFLGNRRSDRRIADIGVHLDAEIAPDDHRLQLRMVDVGGDNRATGRHLAAHELRRDAVGDLRAETLPRMLLQQRGIFGTGAELVEALVLANRDVFHLRRDDALPRIVHLRDIAPRQGAARLADVLETQARQLRIMLTLAAELGTRAVKQFGIPALLDPGATHIGNTLEQVDLDRGIGKGAGGVIDGDRRVLLDAVRGWSVVLLDLAHADLQVFAAALDVDLAGTGEGLGDLARQTVGLLDEILGYGAHGWLL